MCRMSPMTTLFIAGGWFLLGLVAGWYARAKGDE